MQKTLVNRILKSELINWREIQPLQPDNFKLPYNYKDIEKSLDKHGFAMPFFVWEKSGVIYAVDGHTRKEILIQRENVPDQLPAVFIDAKNKRDAIEILLEVYNQKHNPIDGIVLLEFLKTTEIETESINVESLNVVTNIPEITPPTVKDDDFNGNPPTNKDTFSKSGDIYEIGRHRLICGDNRIPEVVEKVLDGNSPYIMVTDPPYGVEYDPAWRNKRTRANGKKIGAFATGEVQNDANSNWTETWKLSPSKVAYIYHAGAFAGTVQFSLVDADYIIRSQIIWVKNNFAISRSDYHYKHEAVWYAVKKGATANWNSNRKQTTVWNIDKPLKSETGHSTQKPVECMAKPISNHKGDVYEPFAGSGTTLVAAEKLGVSCYAIEISPNYCDVIVARMAFNFPALSITRNGKQLNKTQLKNLIDLVYEPQAN
jgi:DNA modification methylase